MTQKPATPKIYFTYCPPPYFFLTYVPPLMQLQPGQHLNEGGCHKRNHHIFAHQFCKIPPSHWCMPSAIARCNMLLLQYPGMQDLTITASNTKTSNTQIRVFQKAWLVIIIEEWLEGFVVWCILFLLHELLIFFVGKAGRNLRWEIEGKVLKKKHLYPRRHFVLESWKKP